MANRVLLKCPCCFEVMVHQCAGSPQPPAALAHVLEKMAFSATVATAPAARDEEEVTGWQPDVENLEEKFELNPEMAKRFAKTAKKRLARKRARQREEQEQEQERERGE